MVPSLKHEFFIPGIFHLIFLDRAWPWVTETAESETTAKGGGLLYHFPIKRGFLGEKANSGTEVEDTR